MAAAIVVAAVGGYYFGQRQKTTDAEKDEDNTETVVGDLSKEDTLSIVQEHYSKRARNEGSCCGSAGNSHSEKMYSQEELELVGEADLSEGCGNPLSFAKLTEGETVVDLGSGAGIDCLLASARVGNSGDVIGVDMTQEMLNKARKVVREKGISTVSYRLGEIEHLPIADTMKPHVT